MSLRLFIQARHVCDHCGQETDLDDIPLGSAGPGSTPREDALMALDCDATTCANCLNPADDQHEAQRAHRQRTREYGADRYGIERAPEYDYDQRVAA